VCYVYGGAVLCVWRCCVLCCAVLCAFPMVCSPLALYINPSPFNPVYPYVNITLSTLYCTHHPILTITFPKTTHIIYIYKYYIHTYTYTVREVGTRITEVVRALCSGSHTESRFFLHAPEYIFVSTGTAFLLACFVCYVLCVICYMLYVICNM
jgi:hypothetical protein